ncbi:P-loop ATPase, Sll1717 family [Sorangium sp. KYC3313]|uniref:P-loop ATPase, Sll1717 family n=1 Tax=Sorangium sp. KYC3313 TaxID=3449740 RepID=UPI003F8AA851
MLSPGNVLGGSQAESDKLLQRAFVETANFRALVDTTDFRVVVGRRGTGKSALYKRVAEELKHNDRIVLHCEVPREHENLALQAFFEAIQADYRSTRAAARLLWRGYVLLILARGLLDHFKLRRVQINDEIQDYISSHASLQKVDSAYGYALRVLEGHKTASPKTLPGQIASDLDLETLEHVVTSALAETRRRAVLLFDKLDDGWRPTAVPTALLGGLILAASDFSERHAHVHVIAFVRDNMFRALAYFDDDFSRHIEGADLRLRWDGPTLLHLIAERIRASQDLKTENDVKIWNRFAQRGVEGREGFERCLHSTLYRPRDLIVLLNRAYSVAVAASRSQIVDTDVDVAARMVSAERLDDLFKEYNVVLPGLRLFAELFRSKRAVWTYGDALILLDDALSRETYTTEAARDFAIFGTAGEIFMALHGVGFLGFQPEPSSPYVFCHDGARSDLANIPLTAPVAVHPCYWRALDITEGTADIELVTQVHDEYNDAKAAGMGAEEFQDRRIQRLGVTVEELHRIAEGDAGAQAFEDWVLRAIKIVFAGALSNVQHQPSVVAAQRRDIVAANCARDGFWHRVLLEYSSREVVFEIRNYSDLSIDDVHQALSCSGRDYGRFVVIVYRTENEGATEKERSWLQEVYTQRNVLPFLLPASMLKRFVSKYRGRSRRDYWESHMMKRLDTHLRNYIGVKSPRDKSRSRSS